MTASSSSRPRNSAPSLDVSTATMVAREPPARNSPSSRRRGSCHRGRWQPRPATSQTPRAQSRCACRSMSPNTPASTPCARSSWRSGTKVASYPSQVVARVTSGTPRAAACSLEQRRAAGRGRGSRGRPRAACRRGRPGHRGAGRRAAARGRRPCRRSTSRRSGGRRAGPEQRRPGRRWSRRPRRPAAGQRRACGPAVGGRNAGPRRVTRHGRPPCRHDRRDRCRTPRGGRRRR